VNDTFDNREEAYNLIDELQKENWAKYKDLKVYISVKN
jgi:hypothetical protein